MRRESSQPTISSTARCCSSLSTFEGGVKSASSRLSSRRRLLPHLHVALPRQALDHGARNAGELEQLRQRQRAALFRQNLPDALLAGSRGRRPCRTAPLPANPGVLTPGNDFLRARRTRAALLRARQSVRGAAGAPPLLPRPAACASARLPTGFAPHLAQLQQSQSRRFPFRCGSPATATPAGAHAPPR